MYTYSAHWKQLLTLKHRCDCCKLLHSKQSIYNVWYAFMQWCLCKIFNLKLPANAWKPGQIGQLQHLQCLKWIGNSPLLSFVRHSIWTTFKKKNSNEWNTFSEKQSQPIPAQIKLRPIDETLIYFSVLKLLFLMIFPKR